MGKNLPYASLLAPLSEKNPTCQPGRKTWIVIQNQCLGILGFSSLQRGYLMCLVETHLKVFKQVVSGPLPPCMYFNATLNCFRGCFLQGTMLQIWGECAKIGGCWNLGNGFTNTCSLVKRLPGYIKNTSTVLFHTKDIRGRSYICASFWTFSLYINTFLTIWHRMP